MDKLLKIIWLVIGIMLMVLLPFIGFHLIKDAFPFRDYPEAYDQSLIVGDEQKEAIKEGKMIQGLIYDQIENIPGTRYHLLPVSAKKFNAAKDIEKFYREFEIGKSMAGDINIMAHGNVNIIFLDHNYNVTNTLVEDKAYISAYDIPQVPYGEQEKLDPTIQNILYQISFQDSNKDGLLNNLDNQDLYISKVDGSVLIQVTKNVDVLDYTFINNNSEVFIEYQKRDSTMDEHKRKLFARYDIAEDTLLELTDLQETIVALEKKLMVDTTSNDL